MSEKVIGIIGGSGLGDAFSEHIAEPERISVETPFGKPGSEILTGRMGKNRIAFINRHGKGHRYSPTSVPYAANIFALKKLGATALIASGAVGSLREEMSPGDLVVVDNFIDKTFKRTNTFFNELGTVHCEMAEPTCSRLGSKVLETARDVADVKTHSGGCYVVMEGPQFSTRAESLMHRQWGGDLIGMTAMPEAKLAREAQMCYSLIALPSDYDCWRKRDPNKDIERLLEEIRGNLQKGTDNAIKLIEAVMERDDIVDDRCNCRHSLELAVWTSQEQIDAKQRKQLDVLFK